MLDYIKIFEEAIKENKPHEYYKLVTDEAKFNKAMYTGLGQKEWLLNYRKEETKEQKDQRERITRTKTKHICRKIENVFDELTVLDKAAKAIQTSNTKQQEDIENWIYNENLEAFAFETVKYWNLIDSNAFCVFGKNKYDDVEFSVIPSDMIFRYYVKSGQLQFVIIKIKRDKFTDYRLYHNEGVIDFKEGRDKDASEFVGDYTVYRTSTGKNYAFLLGWKKNPETEFKTCVSIFEGASELFQSLIWEGSELDVTKALHGIVKTFAYAPRCNARVEIEGSHYECIDGMTGPVKCSNCNGTGLKIHTSNQDIIYLPEPIAGQDNPITLDKMIHTEHVAPEILNLRKSDIKEIENEIVKTVFSSNFTTKSDVAKTATETLVDLKGMYSALGNLGKQVSEFFIWAVECYCDMMGYRDVQISHGYALNLKLEDLDTLLDRRAKAIEAGVPMEIVNVIDFSIMKKQHVDNPVYLDKFSIWKQYMPLSDKTEQERTSIIAGLDAKDPLRIKYIYWVDIKRNIEDKVKDFDKKSHQIRLKLIEDEVNAIIASMPADQLPRVNLNA